MQGQRLQVRVKGKPYSSCGPPCGGPGALRPTYQHHPAGLQPSLTGAFSSKLQASAWAVFSAGSTLPQAHSSHCSDFILNNSLWQRKENTSLFLSSQYGNLLTHDILLFYNLAYQIISSHSHSNIILWLKFLFWTWRCKEPNFRWLPHRKYQSHECPRGLSLKHYQLCPWNCHF